MQKPLLPKPPGYTCVPNRENTQSFRTTTGRFSDLHLTGRFLPARLFEQWTNFFRISGLLAGAGAYSGATAADFNRVPVLIIPGQMPKDL